MGRAGYDSTLLNRKESAAAAVLDGYIAKKAVEAVRQPHTRIDHLVNTWSGQGSRGRCSGRRGKADQEPPVMRDCGCAQSRQGG
ncbi:hypothetical protein Ptr902_13013 [Pyrenophora tritici-repentis]|nr:hypothetical protein Ptr902_13013 [Pyrenophora tritici-repentis]